MVKSTGNGKLRRFLPIQIGLFVLLCFSASAFFRAPAPEDVDANSYQANIASLVGRYLERFHYQQYQLNDSVSKRIFDAYIDDLDPNKLFFLESDIKAFEKYETRLDDDLRANPSRLDAVYAIHDVYRTRVVERVAVAHKMLAKKMDFGLNEYHSYDREKAPWAKTTAELDDLWRRRIKDEMLLFKLREKPEAEYLEILGKRYDRLKKNIGDLEKVDIVETFLSSLSSIYDPHSAYLKPATKDNFDIQMGHSLEGIGATLTTEAEYTKVTSLVKGGPADRSGQIKPNDKIIAVAQDQEEAQDVIDMRLDKVVKQIRGPKGSKVRLTIIPGDATDNAQTKEVVLVRDRVELKSRDAKAEIKELEDETGKIHRLGVINVPSFYLDTQAKYRGDRDYKSTTRDVRRLLQGLEEKKVDGIVIDLRTNGGGSLDEAIQLTGLFIDYGPVVQIKNFQGKVDVEIDPDPSQVYKGPLMVLTSVFSASASEIFASALQDYGRAVVVGAESTHGKGTVQNVASLQTRLNRELDQHFKENIAGALKLTTHKFYRISGGSTQHKGVLPDVTLPSPYDGMKVKEEDLDFALPWDEIEPVAHKSYNQVRPSLSLLKKNSTTRVASNPEFHYVREDLERLQERRERNRVSLNLDQRQKEKEDDKARAEARKQERKLRKAVVAKSEPLFPEDEVDEPEDIVAETAETAEDAEEEVTVPDFILNETLLIMRDYVNHRGELVAGFHPKKDSL